MNERPRVYHNCVGSCRRCRKHELVDGSNLCGDCYGNMLAGLPCRLCRQPMGDTDPPFLDGRRVCPSCWEQERYRRSA